MELILKKSSWRCMFCNMTLTAAEDLCWHVVGNSHRTALWNFAPNLLTEVGRLQCFLDTYLHGEPILGLEYVEEQRVGPAYLYTCLLCNAKTDWRRMFFHIIDTKHVERYIDKHHHWLLPRREDFPDRRSYIITLIAATSKVYLIIGGKSIRQQEEVGKNGNAAMEECAVADRSEEQSSLKRKKEMDSERGAKRSRRSREIREYLKKFTNRDHFCSLCSVSCPTTVDLYEHITGVVHEGNLARLAPEQMKESNRLCNFLDTYMRGEPILGLGLIEEKEADTMYMYRCLLCRTQENWPYILTHLLTVNHVGRYIEKYHRPLAHKPGSFHRDEDFVKAVIASAIRVYKIVGDASMPQTTCEDDGEKNKPSPLDGNTIQKELPCSIEEISDEITPELEVLGVSSVQKHFCRLCQLAYPNAKELCKHLLGKSHISMLGNVLPEVLQRLTSLQYYMGTLLKNEPFVGLEYIVQKERRTSCFYECLLCSWNTDALRMLLHIGGAKHIMHYILKNHRGERMFPQNAPKQMMKTYASQICKLYGRKQIQNEHNDMHSLPKSKVDGLPSQHDRKNNRAVPLRKVVREVISGSTGNSRAHKIEVKIAHKSHTCDIGEPAWAEEDEEENFSQLDSSTVQRDLGCPGEKMPLNFPKSKSDEITQELEALGVSSVHKHFCRLCQLSFPNDVVLCRHLMTSKHRSMLGDAPPELLQRLTSLKYFLGTLLKNEPIVGLEYIVQKEHGTSYVYSCLLCNSGLKKMSSSNVLIHIVGSKHIKKYIMEEHSGNSTLPSHPYSAKRLMKGCVSQVCELYGRKEIRYEQEDTCNPAESNVDGLP